MSREITERRRSWLSGELDTWRSLGLISEDQAREVLSLYTTPQEFIARRQSKGVMVLMALAATLVGLSLLLVIGYNWSDIPDFAKVTAVFGSLIVTHAAGAGLRWRKGLRRESEILFFIGCIIYGSGIWLLAQIFNISSEDAGGFWWWALGVLPFALILDTLLLHIVFVALMAIWAGTEVLNYSNLGFWLFRRFPYIPDGAFSLVPLSAPGLIWAYKKRDPRAVALYVALFTWWVILQAFAWNFGRSSIEFIGAVGALLLLAAQAHRPESPMAVPYRLYGSGILAGVLLPLSYHAVNEQLSRGMDADLLQKLAPTVAILFLAAITLAEVVFARRRAALKSGIAPLGVVDDLVSLAKRQSGPCLLLVFFVGLAFWRPIIGEPFLPTLLANVAMLGLAFWLIKIGLAEDKGRPFGAGVLYFLLWAVLRYIDLFGAYGGMLGGALMFFLCGATLFGVALYWRNRKAVSLV